MYTGGVKYDYAHDLNLKLYSAPGSKIWYICGGVVLRLLLPFEKNKRRKRHHPGLHRSVSAYLNRLAIEIHHKPTATTKTSFSRTLRTPVLSKITINMIMPGTYPQGGETGEASRCHAPPLYPYITTHPTQYKTQQQHLLFAPAPLHQHHKIGTASPPCPHPKYMKENIESGGIDSLPGPNYEGGPWRQALPGWFLVRSLSTRLSMTALQRGGKSAIRIQPG